MAAMPRRVAVPTAAQLWVDNWDEEDQVDQQELKQENEERSVTPQVAPQVAPLSETPDCWYEVDEDTLVDIVQPKKAPAPAKNHELTEKLADSEMLAAPSLPAGEELAPKAKAAEEERYWGKVSWFSGSYGWVTSAKVKTGRTVHPKGFEIKHAIFLSKNDCQGFLPRFDMDVHFRLGSDEKGNSKAFEVTNHMMTLKQLQKSRESVSVKPHKDDSSNAPSKPNPPRKESRADLTSNAPWKRKVVPLNARTLAKHTADMQQTSCTSSTAPGSSANTSVASELDLQSQPPRHMHSSIAVSTHFQIVEATEEPASEPVPEHSEDEVREKAHVEEAASDQRPVAETWEDLCEEEIWDQPPVAAPAAENWEVGEVPECWCPKRPRQKMVNKKLAKPKTSPLAQFCEAMGPEFPFEFVARHLGTDFDAIVQSAWDVHSLDSLVRAGMKPLHRNKLCRALRREMEQRVTRRESPKQELADFLAKIGPEFNSAFVAHNLGTNDLDEILTRFTDLNDLDVLVVAGMKPLFRNKLHRQLALERKRLAAEC